MSRKQRYIQDLTEKEQSSLTKGYKTGKSPIYQRRCQSILLSSKGYSVNALADLFSVSVRTIYNWFNLWESSGIEGLKLQAGRGRKKKLNSNNTKHIKVVKRLVENDPQQLNRVVLQIKSELGIEVSKKTLQRFLKKTDSHGNVLGVKQNLSLIQMSIKQKKPN